MQRPAQLPPRSPAVARRGSGLRVGLAILGPVLFGFGCAQAPSPDTGVIAPPPAAPGAAAKPSAAEKARAAAAATSGFQPLPTPQQVLGSVPLGRRDPFAQLITSLPPGTGPDGQPAMREPERRAAAERSGSAGGGQAAIEGRSPAGGRAGRSAAARPPLPPLQLPSNFSFTGVIRSGGITEAIVSYGAFSGSLRSGDRGGRTTDLLPSGWKVTSVDVNQGLLTLQQGSREVKARL